MNTPYFLWDYDLSEEQIRAILHGTNETEKLWLVGRILTHARYEDIWKYLKVADIIKTFPKLRLDAKTQKAWQRALQVWGYHV